MNSDNVLRWLNENFVPSDDKYVQDLDTMAYQYIRTLLWAETDESDPEMGGNPLDDTFSPEDMTDEFWERVRKDVYAFVCADLDSLWRLDPSLAGHDLWLTRQHHGAGFWDGDWDKIAGPGAGELLTSYVRKTLPEIDLYVGDDDLLYFS